VEHEERADELEHEAETLEQHSDRVGEHIEEARRDWEAKQGDPTVPGAQPHGEEEESLPGVVSDEETLSEEGGP
jgi:hypothetical protein